MNWNYVAHYVFVTKNSVRDLNSNRIYTGDFFLS